MRELQGKVILITGASSGIGQATAIACAQAGMHVSLVARRGDKLQKLAANIAGMGQKAHFFSADVCNTGDMKQAFADCWSAFGRLDAVFANAGYGQVVNVLDMTEQDERAMFETNYFGTTRALRMAVPLMRQTPEGLNHLLLCSSAASEIGLPTLGVYSATKAAQDSIAGALRAELHDEGFKVTSVHPIGTKTDFMSVAGDQENKNTPAAFQQTPEQVAERIVASLRRPRPEVWTSRITRLGLAMGTLSPRFASWAMRRHYRKLQRESESKQ